MVTSVSQHDAGMAAYFYANVAIQHGSHVRGSSQVGGFEFSGFLAYVFELFFLACVFSALTKLLVVRIERN